MDNQTKPRVFISYTHDTQAHKKKVLDLANRLNREGIDCWCDQYIEGSTPERGWPLWMEENVRIADYVLVVCTETYLKRCEGREEEGVGDGAKFESVLLIQHLYKKGSVNKKIIPVLLTKDDKKFIPSPLEPFTHYRLYKDEDYISLYRRITNQIAISKPPVGEIIKFPSHLNIDSSTLEGVVVDTVELSTFCETDHLQQIPEIPEITESMKPGLKIVQAFFTLPLTKRFSIAEKLGLLENGESFNSEDREQICSKILLRAKSNGLMASLWTELFDEAVEPNPFK
jgi:hypothetical protein